MNIQMKITANDTVEANAIYDAIARIKSANGLSNDEKYNLEISLFELSGRSIPLKGLDAKVDNGKWKVSVKTALELIKEIDEKF